MGSYKLVVPDNITRAMRAAADQDHRKHITDWINSVILRELEKKGLWKPQPHLAHLDDNPRRERPAVQPVVRLNTEHERLRRKQIADMDAELAADKIAKRKPRIMEEDE